MKITLWTGDVVVGKEAMVDLLTDGYFEGMDSLKAEDVIEHFRKLLSSDKISEEIVAALLKVQDDEFCAMPNK